MSGSSLFFEARKNRLSALLAPSIDPQFSQSSRCHPLYGFVQRDDNPICWVKREDELNPSAIGSKMRKYFSLLPHLQRSGSQSVILIGSAHSNNVVGLTQLLRAQGVQVTAMVKRPGDQELKGNWLYLNLLLPAQQIIQVAADDWPRVEEIATKLCEITPSGEQAPTIIPEGGDHEAVLPGILTAALDLIRNEAQYDRRFDHLWTDAGTGISAIGLVLGLHYLGLNERTVHITLIAGDEAAFEKRYLKYQRWLEQLSGESLPATRPRLVFHKPATAAAFGSLNQTVLNETLTIARDSGLLLDPVYSVKHFLTVRQALSEQPGEGNHLVFYNGATQGLNGFQARLAFLLK